MKRNFFSFAFALVAAVTLSAGVAVAQTAPGAGAKAYIPNTTKAELAFYLQNPAAQGGLGAFNLSTFEFHVGGVNFTNQVLALLGGRGSQLYINPAGTSMTAYVAGTFTGIPFANAPVMAKACLLTGQCVSTERYLQFRSGYPNTAVTTSSVAPLSSFSTGQGENTYSLSAVHFSTSTPVVITKLAGIGSTHTTTANWALHNPKLNIWQASGSNSLVQEFDNSPVSGNLASNIPLSFTHNLYYNQGYDVHYAQYTLSTPIVLQPGSYLFSIKHQLIGTGPQVWGFMMTSANPNSDLRKWKGVSAPNPAVTWASVVGPTGALGIDLIGY